MLAAGAMVMLLSWQVVQLGWSLLAARRPAAPPIPVATAAPPAPEQPQFDISAIVNAHLFGNPAPVAPTDADPNSVAATQSQLVLVGTIAQTDPKQGFAIIGADAASAKLYAVGKTLDDGAVVHSVYTDRVIIDRGGQLEALMMPKLYTAGAMQAGAPSAGSIGQQLQQAAAQNPSQLTEVMRPQPVFADGQQRGYRVYPGRNRKLFNRLGLLPGDMVTAVNGTPLDDPARSMEVLNAMNSASNVLITLERNGVQTQVNISNAQLAAEAAGAVPDPQPVAEAPQMPSPEPTE
jgi:general secretion pathway protein C